VGSEEQIQPAFGVGPLGASAPGRNESRVRQELGGVDEDLAATAADVLPVVPAGSGGELAHDPVDASVEVRPARGLPAGPGR
jgi:hypothetical protein